MSEPHNGESGPLRVSAKADRAAKLRALGREAKLQGDLEISRMEAAAREQNLKEQLQAAERRAAEREREFANREREFADREREFKDREREFKDWERELNAQLEASRAQLQMVLNSRSWKLTRPLRALSGRGRSQDREEAAPSDTQESNASPTLPSVASSPSDVEEANASSPDTSPPASSQVVQEPDPGSDSEESFATGGRDAWDEVGLRQLNESLAGTRRLVFADVEQPAISIIIALYNKAHLGLLCLESILRHADVTYEVILVDNASTDRTGELLGRLDGVEIIRNQQNLGFGYACVQGAQKARGECLCFLNNDALLGAKSLEVVVQDFREDKTVGAIGGKLLLADGRLQEAGSMVWNDGSTWGYGREDDPDLPRYNFRRPVDYCSGAFLFTPRSLFDELGGFDERFFPAYYEDADYCFKVWERGLKVIYEPRAAVHHYESASSESAEAAKVPIENHRARFAEKWQRRLAKQWPRNGDNIARARIALQAGGVYILCMSDRVPHRELGPEYAAVNAVLTRLTTAGHHVTLASMDSAFKEDERADIACDIELADVMTAGHYVFRELLPAYDVVWISGRQNMRSFLRRMWNMYGRIPPIIYEAEAISTEEADALDEQAAVCEAADVILVSSEGERELLRDKCVGEVRVVAREGIDKVLVEAATTLEEASFGRQSESN